MVFLNSKIISLYYFSYSYYMSLVLVLFFIYIKNEVLKHTFENSEASLFLLNL